MKNALAYLDTNLITALKGFIAKASCWCHETKMNKEGLASDVREWRHDIQHNDTLRDGIRHN